MNVRQGSDVCRVQHGGSKAWALPDAPCCTTDFCRAEVVEKSLRELKGGERERGMMLDTRITHYGFMHVCTCVGAEGRWKRLALVKNNHCNFKIPTICRKVWSKYLSTSLSPLFICVLPSQPGASNRFGFWGFFSYCCLIWGDIFLSQLFYRQYK